MTFNEAVEEMKKLAGDSPWAFSYEVASYLQKPRIGGYIADLCKHAPSASTYEGAIANVRTALNLTSSSPPPEEEAND